MKLTTERLMLREFEEDDWPAVLTYQSDPRYLRYYEWTQRTPEEAQAFVRMFVTQQQQQPRIKFQLAAVLRETNQLIGNCGIRLATPDARQADIGYEFSPLYWRQGYATEAARAILSFGFDELGLHRVWSWCIADNIGSAGVLQKIGMRLEGRQRENEYFKGRWWDTLLFGILRAEWQAQQQPARNDPVGVASGPIDTTIIDLQDDNTDLIDRLTPLVYEAFQSHAPNWLSTVDEARSEILESLEPGKISRVLVDSAGSPLGWVGAIPHSQGRVWEIHPLVVSVSAQGKGYGRWLMADIERLAQAQGALTLEVGTSDETNATSLSGVDLYQSPVQAIANLRSLKRHAYEFYLKIGFKVVGLMPDAEGRGKPGIVLAKRVEQIEYSSRMLGDVRGGA